MKLKIHDLSNVKAGISGVPAIRVALKGGGISMNRKLVSELKLAHGDKIIFAQDEERPQDWYMATTASDTGFILRQQNKRGLHFNSAGLAEKIEKSLKQDFSGKRSIQMIVGLEPIENAGSNLFPIITKSAK